MDKAPLPRLSCEPLISDQNYCLQQYSLLDVPKLSSAYCQAFYLRLPDLPSTLKRCPALLFLQTEQWLRAWILPAPSPDIIFRLCQLWGSNIASGGLCLYVLPNPVPRESHSRSDRHGSGKVKNNFSLSGMLWVFLFSNLRGEEGDILSLLK